MRIIGNLLWWLFGGLEAAIGYFTGSLALACTSGCFSEDCGLASCICSSAFSYV